MKRAKHPPTKDVVDEATIIADVIAVGRRAEVEERIEPLVKLAMSEYMRRYKARKQNDDPWVEMPLLDHRPAGKPLKVTGSGYPGGGVYLYPDGGMDYSTGETDYQCFFCRKSLNTMPRFRVPNKTFREALRTKHIDECGIRFLAGIGESHKPLPNGEPGR